ncbi:MAG: hypothetical protein HQ582_24755 [Planctomycetes bacterium]|nr:hypothetical protein [Planctomycetota bacterium]
MNERDSSIGQSNRQAASFVGCAFSFSRVRFLLGGILLTAASLKAGLLFTSAAGPFETWEFGLVLFELVFAAWLFSGRLPSLAWWAATGCFATFAAVAAFKLLHGDADCGCFGIVRTPPWVALSIDVAALAALLTTYHDRSTTGTCRSTFVSRLPAAAGYALILLVATRISLPLVLADGLRRGSASTSDPSRWVGQRLPLLEQIDIGAELSSGEWTAVLHRHDCALCGETLKCLSPSDVDRGVSAFGRIALVELPPYADTHDVGSSELVRTARLAGREAHWLPVPVVVHLKDGRVISVAVGEQSRASLLRILGGPQETPATTAMDLRARHRQTIALLEPRE